MQITFFSFIVSIFCSSVLITIAYIFRRQEAFIRSFGVSTIMILYLTALTRLLVPFEFPFTYEVEVEGVVSHIVKTIYLDQIEPVSLSIAKILCIIWVDVMLLRIVSFIYQYYKVKKEVKTYKKCEDDDQYSRVFNKIQKDRKVIKVDIRCSDSIHIPVGIGVFKKAIILPDEDYSDLELEYILLHEYTHFLNRDPLVKMLVHLFCCIYWWNPIVYLLKKDLDKILEIKCDLCVTEMMKKTDKAAYLTTILNVLRKSGNKSIQMKDVTTALLQRNSNLELVERFTMVVESSHQNAESKTSFSGRVLLLSILVMGISYLFVVQPLYHPPADQIETDDDTYELDSENSYLIENSDGSYVLVYKDGTRISVTQQGAELMIEQGFNVRKKGEK